MKRFLSLAILGLMAVSFSACTKKEEAAPAPTTEQAVQAPAAEVAPAPETQQAPPAPAPEQQPGS